jgi:hypothetical protein
MDYLFKRLNIRYVISHQDHQWNISQIKLHLALTDTLWTYTDYYNRIVIWAQPND